MNNHTTPAETREKTVRDHVTTLHLIGEQLAQVESWMWQHLADVREATDPGAVSAVRPPATDRTALREQIAEAIRAAACPGDCGKTEEECARERIQPFAWHHGRLAVVEGEPEMFADAVLAVLPAVDQAAVLREAADWIDAGWFTTAASVTAELRRLAAESAAVVPDQTDDEARVHVGGNAEDCPACDGTNPPYPFLCPGPADAPAVGGAQQPKPFTPPAHYRRDDGVDCCVHTIPVGPDSCRACRELADDEVPE